MARPDRAWRATGIALAALTLALLVLGIVPLRFIVPLGPHVELWRAKLAISWDPPATPPPAGTWAGQTNHYGFRYNRTSDGAGYFTIPLWLFAVPVGIAALLVARRARHREAGFPIIGMALLALVPIVLTLLCIRGLLDRDEFCVGQTRCVRLDEGRITLLSLRWLGPRLADSYIWVSLEQFGSFRVSRVVRPVEPALSPPGIGNLFGFGAGNATVAGQTSVDAMAVPYWPLILLSVIPPIVLLQHFLRRRRRLRLNLCIHCGYDLRQSPEMCPECGAPTDAGRAAGRAASSVAL